MDGRDKHGYDELVADVLAISYHPPMNERAPVSDWATDFDHLDPRWQQDPYPIWNALRSACPFATTKRFGGAVLPTRYDDIRAIAFDTAHLSSRQIIVRDGALPGEGAAPPMTSDPPHHREARHLLSPLFRSEAVAALAPSIQRCCDEALDKLASAGRCDAAGDYTRTVSAGVLLPFLGLRQTDLPVLRPLVDILLDEGVTDTTLASDAMASLSSFMMKQIARQRTWPGDGVLGYLLRFRSKDGHALPDAFIRATMRLLLAAGMDTTAGALGASLWHLARNEADRCMLIERPELLSSAIEEFLRLYAPVTMAREVVAPVAQNGFSLERGQKVLLCFPAANRDPAMFPEPDRFVADRKSNRHFAFGTGIHRCLGAELATLIVRIALECWLTRVPLFQLDPEAEVQWSRGSVRGPKVLPLLFG